MPSWVLAAIAIALVIYLQLRAIAVPPPGPKGEPVPRDPLDLIKTTITVAGFVGAILVGVYGYRKQRLTEGDAHRADAEQLAQRYTTAAGQLGHEKAAVRLGGVFSMARLADDWDEQRKECIEVLCAYLRMPYETDPTSPKYREGEREVRLTIIRLIRDHLRDPDSADTWCDRDLDFTGATFDGGDFHLAMFTGHEVSFDHAKFIGGETSFIGAQFVGSDVSFHRAEFISGNVLFNYAKFTDGRVLFNHTEFAGGEVSFVCAEFATGSNVSFFNSRFITGPVTFNGATFSGDEVSFLRAEFAGGKVHFGFAEFIDGEVSFDNAEFIGGEVFFGTAKHTGGDVSFDDAEFTGTHITWGPFEPLAAWTSLQDK
jgi:uncharacterized protein YjbI with pentapeptide repeats